MSADLFAAFGDSPQTSGTQQSQPTPSGISATATPAPSDPFSILSVESSASQTQDIQKTAPWTSLQQTTAGRQTDLLRVQAAQPQMSTGWADLSSLGGQGAFQDQGLSLPGAQKTVQPDEDDDTWGDFEVAPTTSPPPPAVSASMAQPPRARVTRASTLDILSNKLLDLAVETPALEPWQERPSWEKPARTEESPRPARNPDPNVLFDADFEAEGDVDSTGDDEFGDFETGTDGSKTHQAATAKPSQDLLLLDPTPAPTKKQPPGLVLSNTALPGKASSYPEAPKSPYGSFQERKPEPVKQLQVQLPTATRVLSEPNQASPSPVTAWPSFENDDGFGNKWEEFKDLPDIAQTAGSKPLTSKNPSKTKSNPTPASAAAPEWDWQDWGGTDDVSASQKTGKTNYTAQWRSQSRPPPSPAPDKPGPPPTNIPPPAILLSLMPQLLNLASASLLKPLLTLPSSSAAYQHVVSSPNTLAFLRAYLMLATVAARLVAGRKQRWHRDKFLSQAMSISAAPSSSGGRGMKLATVDRSQSAREDSEAGEVVAAWKANVGRLRAVVAAVNAAQGASLRVPDVGSLAVSTAKGVPTAPRACVVCGLKRDERVARVDVEVEDSFGEWWVEFWGHRECRNFWVEHEKELRQR